MRNLYTMEAFSESKSFEEERIGLGRGVIGEEGRK